jgi:nucleoside-diphosphate kinase
MEQTLIILKPDAVQRSLISDIVGRFERRGLRVAAMKLMQISKELAEKHYEEHKEKSFFKPTVEYMTSGPVVVMVLEGKDVVLVSRSIIGATNPTASAPGTIRGDLAINIGRNLVHGSDKVETAIREISLYFTKEEVLSYTRVTDSWLTE